MNPLQILNWLILFRLPLGRWFDVPVFLHSSFLLILGILTWRNPDFGIVWGAIFFIVLLHEFGHVLAAKSFGWRVENVVLYPFGGIASMQISEFEPKKELVMALAGPAVNLAIAILSLPLWGLNNLLNTVLIGNIVLMVFNLLPAFPMDGGRVVRSLWAWYTGNLLQATQFAARLGQVLAGIFVALGFMWGATGLAVIGIFVFFGADQELKLAQWRSEMSGGATNDFLRSVDQRLSEVDRRFGA